MNKCLVLDALDELGDYMTSKSKNTRREWVEIDDRPFVFDLITDPVELDEAIKKMEEDAKNAKPYNYDDE